MRLVLLRQKLIQIGAGHQVGFLNIEDHHQLIGDFRTFLDGLLWSKAHLELQEMSQTLHLVQVDASLFMQE